MNRTITFLSHVVVALVVALVMTACGSPTDTTGPNTARALSIDVQETANDGDYRLVMVNGKVPCIEYTGRPDGAGKDAYDLECDFTNEHFNEWVD